MKKLTILASAVIVVLMGLAAPVAAQTADSFEQLRITPGTHVFVIDREGRETKGVLMRVTPASIAIARHGGDIEIPASSVARIEKTDGLRNGALVGAAIGGLLGTGLGQIQCEVNCGAGAAIGAAMVGGIGAAIGAISDAAVKGRTLLYRSSSTVIVPGDSPTPFANLSATVKQGDMIQVIDPAGRKTTGKLQDISGSSILVLVDGQPRDISASVVQRIVKRRDPLWNGLAIGAAIGLLGGVGGCEFEECAAALAGSSIFYGAIGAGVDALMGRSQIAYVAASDPKASASRVSLALSGVLTPKRKAVGVSVRF